MKGGRPVFVQDRFRDVEKLYQSADVARGCRTSTWQGAAEARRIYPSLWRWSLSEGVYLG